MVQALGRQEKGMMSRGLEAGDGRVRGAAPRGQGLQGGWRGARLGRPATLRRPRAARSAAEGPPAPLPLSAGQNCERPYDPKRVPRPSPPRPAKAPRPQTPDTGPLPPPPPPPPGGPRRAGPKDCRGDARPERPSRRPPAPPPTPARLPSSRPLPPPQAARSSPHLHAGPHCRPKHKSVPLTRRGVGRKTVAPHTIPAGPPLRPFPSPLGILPREPPYYGATKLRSHPSIFHSSLPPSLPPSLPRSLSPAYLPISLEPPPPHHPSVSAHRWVMTTVYQS
nr:basic proline-rich protein-like [Cavia porcellus]